jgi:HEAT repeat protein
MVLDSYLQELKDRAQPLAASRLSQLSALSNDELTVFGEAWPQIDVARRRQIIRRLLDLAEDNVDLDFDAVFIAGLADEDAEVRYMAVQGLWEYEGRDLISPLIDLLERDPDSGVRAQAALALGAFALRAEVQQLSAADGQRVEQALHAAIDNPEETVEVRARALESAGARSLAWVRRSIEEAYRSPHRRLRVGAVHAMGRHCDPRWLPILMRELASGDAEMRYEAANACASMGGEAAVPELVALLEDEDVEVQEAAVAALGEIGGEEARAALEGLREHPEARMREAAAAALELMEFNEDSLGFGPAYR